MSTGDLSVLDAFTADKRYSVKIGMDHPQSLMGQTTQGMASYLIGYQVRALIQSRHQR